MTLMQNENHGPAPSLEVAGTFVFCRRGAEGAEKEVRWNKSGGGVAAQVGFGFGRGMDSLVMQVLHLLPPIFYQPDWMVKDCG
jgi:hypothetical protein